MKAEVIAIGDELVTGQRLDTNSRWLSQQLASLGFQPTLHTTLGDSLSMNIDVFRRAAESADVVVCTGGLGPTLDDLTRQAFAEAFERPLELDEASLEHIRSLFAARNRQMPERNLSQAMFPAGSQPIPNPHGSAPGIDLALDSPRCRFFALPGVPAEMFEMWKETVVPRLEQMTNHEAGPLRFYSLKLFGIGESDVEVRLPDLIARERYPTVGITVSKATITLRIAARATSNAAFEQIIAPTIAEIQEQLGDLIFGEGDEELENAVAGALAAQGLSLATVEIGAASPVADWLLQADSDAQLGCYAGGVSLPSMPKALEWAGIDQASHSSEEDLCHIAEKVQQRFRSDIALVISGYPSQQAMATAKQSFPFEFALAQGTEYKYFARNWGGHPEVLIARTGKAGLDFVRKHLLGQETS